MMKSMTPRLGTLALHLCLGIRIQVYAIRFLDKEFKFELWVHALHTHWAGHTAISLCSGRLLTFVGFRPALPLPVGEITRIATECDSVDAADHIAKLQARLNDLEHALLEIESQFRRNALDWHLRHAQKIGKCQQLHPGDLVLELDTTPGPLRANARGPYIFKAVKPKGTVVLTFGETDFKDRVDFERDVSLRLLSL